MDWKTERLKLHGLRFFFLPSPNWQQAGSPLVLMKLREDRALKCVLNVLNGTPDAFQRLTKEQLITCNWANWNQRSASVDEWWWALRGRDAVTLNHFHGLHMAEPLTPGNSVFSTECLIRRCLLQNALTRQLCLISNLLSWRQKLKSHHVFKETIRCLLSYLLPFLQTNRPTGQRTVLTLVSVFALHVYDLTVISGDGGDGSGQWDTYLSTRPQYNFQPCFWWPEQIFEATTWSVSNPERFLCLNPTRSSQPRHNMKNHKVSKLLFDSYIHFQ